MDDRTQPTAYTPAKFMADLKDVLDKAVTAGISPEHVAQATMEFAHSYWDECYGAGQEQDLIDKIKRSHTPWDSLEDSMQAWGYSTPTDVS